MSELTMTAPAVLAADEWATRAQSHRSRAQRFLDPHARRAAAGEPHPVWDFLFTYYSLRPRQVRRWHPGYGVALAGPEAARDYRNSAGYLWTGVGVTVSGDYLRSRLESVRFIARLLAATAGRPAQLNCFGLHEWALVYRSDGVRHRDVPLRLGAAGTDRVVESMPLRCSHFDAFRFFTPEAAPRNTVALTRHSQVDREQPGCVHANMDLYKWCYKLGPLVESGLLLDCLELAAAARELDMRASPYDLSGFGFAPIQVEEPSGRAEYARCQRELAQKAIPLRSALHGRCDLLVAAAA